MTPLKSPYDRWLLLLVDIILWFVAMAGALWLRFEGDVPSAEVEFYLRFVPLAGAGMLVAFLYSGAYEREVDEPWALRDTVIGWLIGLALATGVLFLLKIPYSRFAFLVGSGFFLLLTLVVRRGMHWLVHGLSATRRPRVVYVVGTGDKRPELSDRLGGVQLVVQSHEALDPAFETLSEDDPDMILIQGEAFEPDAMRRLIEYGSRMGIPVRILPDADQLFLAGTRLIPWRGQYFLESEPHHRLRQQLALKTIFDYVLGGLFLALSLPLQGTVALLILVFDGRPVLYRQTRTGRAGRPFTLYKFRTMVPEADEKGPELTQGAEDPRITVLGRFLRRWSLDELPQLFNVVRGEMSLVGPRPEIPSITRHYDPEDRRLFWLKPGLTGLSQVSGRQSLDLPEKLATDQYYLSEYSLLLDLWILARTVLTVLRGKGAA